MERLFTKSAFKQALFCPASLYYYYDREHYANQMKEALLRYCELDTMSMVFIWEYFHEMTS